MNLSSSKLSILKASPDSWLVLRDINSADNQRCGLHLHQMHQKQLFEKKVEPSPGWRPMYRLTELGLQVRDSRG